MAAPIRMHHAAGIDVNLFFSSAVEFSIGGGSYWGGNIALPVTVGLSLYIEYINIYIQEKSRL